MERNVLQFKGHCQRKSNFIRNQKQQTWNRTSFITQEARFVSCSKALHGNAPTGAYTRFGNSLSFPAYALQYI
ncbi:MAG: hypothetical protein NTX06_09455, partial [Proteobacteria bacterium]|nr:hypothetical protein [Pseudomonadota bacterium]